ncbi:hypothetical protein KFL_002630136 [Klebsormidium nitens]|uniref:Uncharacterized protein n=1 Tax=Klebsormidium nitens TaxID=105231 RepID=A0A1Y1I4V2_KLENI|nr:hypothetical protein KFL_002630136 [Klebsormidium nitens]|eukprot:GAQ85970.1 hypothetical protein KFL_002630136 [Klebsormidium nitens]
MSSVDHEATPVESRGAGDGRRTGTETCCELLCAILLPPLGVFVRYGCGFEFWICLLLTFLGYIPGVIYAACVLL